LFFHMGAKGASVGGEKKLKRIGCWAKRGGEGEWAGKASVGSKGGIPARGWT